MPGRIPKCVLIRNQGSHQLSVTALFLVSLLVILSAVRVTISQSPQTGVSNARKGGTTSSSSRPRRKGISDRGHISYAGTSRVSTSPNLANERTLYVVGYAHLDTEWRWEYPQTIGEYLPKTLRNNFALFDKYPHYIFNFKIGRASCRERV